MLHTQIALGISNAHPEDKSSLSLKYFLTPTSSPHSHLTFSQIFPDTHLISSLSPFSSPKEVHSFRYPLSYRSPRFRNTPATFSSFPPRHPSFSLRKAKPRSLPVSFPIPPSLHLSHRKASSVPYSSQFFSQITHGSHHFPHSSANLDRCQSFLFLVGNSSPPSIASSLVRHYSHPHLRFSPDHHVLPLFPSKVRLV